MKTSTIAILLLVAAGCSASNTDETTERAGERVVSAGDIFNFGTLAHPGSCMDAQGAGTADGTQIQEWTCNGSGAQAYEARDLGGGTFALVNTNANKCVDIYARGTANGTKVGLWDCNGTPAQSFFIQDAGNGFVKFVNTNSGKCLDVAGDDPNDGTVVQLWDCNGTNAQKWNPAVIGGHGPAPVQGGSGNMHVVNRCSFPVWVGILNNFGDPLPVGGGFELASGQSYGFDTAFTNGSWGGRIWGRTGCDGAGANCQTGNCGQTQCGGAGGAPPATLAEFTIVQGGTTFYDVSLVDGYNLQMQIAAAGCPTVGCTSDLNAICPPALQQRDGSGRVVACRSDCEQYNTDSACCRSGPDACHANPPADAHIFKQACPQAYSYAYDDATSTFTCQNQTAYTVTFCP
jgi:hypothetical protein